MAYYVENITYVLIWPQFKNPGQNGFLRKVDFLFQDCEPTYLMIPDGDGISCNRDVRSTQCSYTISADIRCNRIIVSRIAGNAINILMLDE